MVGTLAGSGDADRPAVYRSTGRVANAEIFKPEAPEFRNASLQMRQGRVVLCLSTRWLPKKGCSTEYPGRS